MNCSIVIVNWNTRDLLDQCLASLEGHEIIVVDNASTDGSFELAQKYAIRWIQNSSNVGMAKGLNQGIAVTTGDVILCLHPDTVVKEGCIDSILTYMTDKDVAIVGPRMIYPDGSLFLNTHHFPKISYLMGEASSFLRFLGMKSVYMRNEDHSVVRDVDIIASAGLFLRRSVYEAVGQFDEEFTNWMAEWDYCYRVKQHGNRIQFVPLGTIIHYENQTPGLDGEMEYKKYSYHVADKMLAALFLFYKKCWPEEIERLKTFTILRFQAGILKSKLKGDARRVENYKKAIEFVKGYD